MIVLAASFAVVAFLACTLLELRFRGALLAAVVAVYVVLGRSALPYPPDVLPLTPSEVMLAAGATAAFVRRDLPSGLRWVPKHYQALFGLLTLVWLAAAIAGLDGSLAWTARYSVLWLYSLYCILAVVVFQTPRDLERWFGWVVAIVGLSALAAAAGFVQPTVSLRGGYLEGCLILIALVHAALYRRHRLWLLAAAALFAADVVRGEVRSIWVAFLAACAFLAVLAVVDRRYRFGARAVLHLVATLGVASVLGIILLIPTGSSLPDRIAANFGSIFEYNGDPNEISSKAAEGAQRLTLWSDILSTVESQPQGIGLGTPYHYRSVDEDLVFGEMNGLSQPGYNAPHNSYMLLLLRLGIAGLTVYVLIFGSLLVDLATRLAKMTPGYLKMCALGAGLSVCYVLATATTSPIFEAFYVAPILWILAGVTMRSLQLARPASLIRVPDDLSAHIQKRRERHQSPAPLDRSVERVG